MALPTVAPAPSRPSHESIVTAVVTISLAVPGLFVAAATWRSTDRYVATADDSGLAGLGYLMAVVIGAPSALGIVLALPALALWRRMPRTARALGITGLVIVGVPAVFFLSPYLESL